MKKTILALSLFFAVSLTTMAQNNVPQAPAQPPLVIDTNVCNFMIKVQSDALSFIAKCKYSGELSDADNVRVNINNLARLAAIYKAQLMVAMQKKHPADKPKTADKKQN